MRGRQLGGAAAVAVYIAVALVATWPLPRVGTDHLVAYFPPEDIILHLWDLTWDVHALGTAPRDLFNGNMMYPMPNTLALSEHVLGHLPLFAPAFALCGNPVLAFNIDIFLTFVLCGAFTHWLVLRWTGSTLAAYTAGLAFAVAPWRLIYFHWPQLLSIQYFPIVLYTLDRAATSERFAWGVIAGVALALQMLCSYYLAYMVAVLAGCYAVADVLVRGIRGRPRALASLALAIVFAATVMALVSRPYLELQKAGVLEFLPGVSKELLAQAMAAFGSPHNVLTSVGIWLLALALLAPLAFARAVRGADRDAVARIVALVFMVIAAVGLAVGPAGLLGGWFAPYAWLSAIVPGFSAIRLPTRFALLCSFAVSVLAGFGVAALWRVLGPTRRLARTALAVAALSAALVPLTGRLPLHAYAMPVGDDIPVVYRWLAEHGDGGPLLELPVPPGLSLPGPGGHDEVMAMYFSTVHWLPILNGYSGYFPKSYTELMQQAVRLPDQQALRMLVDCTGLRWILIRAATPAVRSAWDGLPGLRSLGTFQRTKLSHDLLYEVTWQPGARCPLESVPPVDRNRAEQPTTAPGARQRSPYL
jgi:hypothetical protein